MACEEGETIKEEWNVWIENAVTAIMITLRLQLDSYHLGETEYNVIVQKIRNILYAHAKSARDLAKMPTSIMIIPKIRSGIPRFHVENVIDDAERIIAPHNARTEPNKKARSYLSIEPPPSN